jgi:hypothetical protein
VKLGLSHYGREFERRVLSRIFGHKRVEIAGGCRRLHDEELHNLYASRIIVRVIKSREIRWAGHVACMGEMRNAYSILFGNLKGRATRKCEDNIRMDVKEVRWEGVGWIHLV